AINLGKRRNALAPLVIVNQLDTEVHGFALFPRHCFLACRSENSKTSTSINCYLCSRIELLPMSPVWTFEATAPFGHGSVSAGFAEPRLEEAVLTFCPPCPSVPGSALHSGQASGTGG